MAEPAQRRSAWRLVVRKIDRLLPSRLLQDRDSRRRTRSLLTWVLASFATGPLWLVMAALRQDLWTAVAAVNVVVGALTTLLVLRRFERLGPAGHLFTAMLSASVLLALASSPVTNSAMLTLLPLPGVAAVTIIGPRAGLRWAATAMIAALGITFIQPAWTGLAIDTGQLGQLMAGILGAACVVFAACALERGARKGVVALDQKHRELERACRSATAAGASKVQFLANMSHELRTPLNGVLGMAELMETTPLSGDQQELLATLSTSGRSLLRLVNDILDFAKLEHEQLEIAPEPTNLRALLLELGERCSSLAENRGLDLRCKISDSIPPCLQCDPARIGQIVTNMLTHAIRATDRGTIELRVTGTAHGSSYQLEIEVQDSGRGITRERQEALFEPFRKVCSTPSSGVGLGLALARRLARLMGGELELLRQAQRGSTFRFSLRAVIASSAPVLARLADGREQAPRKMLILVADDHPINRSVACRMVERLGHTVVTATDGFHAIQQFGSTPGIDLILMDWEMPRLSGGEATGTIRTLKGGREVPIIALTAHVVQGYRERCLLAGMDDYVTKPLTSETLEEVLARWQGGRIARANQAA